jgi:hypothetical protein
MDYARTAGPETCRVLANVQYLFYPAILPFRCNVEGRGRCDKHTEIIV